MIRNIDKKHRFRVADEGGHGHMGSSEVPTPKLPNVWKLQAPRESRQKLRQSYATDRELERLWNMARKTLMLSVQSTAILVADKIERNWQRSASIHDQAILPHLIGTPTKTPFEIPRFRPLCHFISWISRVPPP
jgi:hypothetical protein